MIERFLLKIFVLVLLVCSPVHQAFGQTRDDAGDYLNKLSKEDFEILQRGAADPEVITALSAHYCSTAGAVEIFVEEAVPSNAVDLVWKVSILTASGWQDAEDNYFDPIGTFPNKGIRFFPD